MIGWRSGDVKGWLWCSENWEWELVDSLVNNACDVCYLLKGWIQVEEVKEGATVRSTDKDCY